MTILLMVSSLRLIFCDFNFLRNISFPSNATVFFSSRNEDFILALALAVVA